MSEPAKVKERVENELRMSLAEHLTELRKRLMRVTGAVLVLGVVSLMYARPLFAVLMRPVLEALPEAQRSLIYTSGIEEINVLMKIGLYAGVFRGGHQPGLIEIDDLYPLWTQADDAVVAKHHF